MKLIVLLLIFVLGCKSYKRPPLPIIFKYIHNQKIHKHIWDCSNKAALYAERLHEYGYKTAHVVVVTTYKKNEKHAVVFVDGAYHCPASGFSFSNLDEVNRLYGGKHFKSYSMINLKDDLQVNNILEWHTDYDKIKE